MNSIRTCLAIIASEDLEAHQYDVKTAFLNSPLKETIYVTEPPGFEELEGMVCRLQKALYGLSLIHI